MSDTLRERKLLGNISMKVSFDKNPYYLTKVVGYDRDEIIAYCKEHNLEVVDETCNSNYRYTIWAEKPNQRMRVLRKNIEQLEDWKLIKIERTPKMYWLTYEKQAKSVK